MQTYYTALKKFIIANPATVSGMELELNAVNPQTKWTLILSNQKKRVQKWLRKWRKRKYLAAEIGDGPGRARVSARAGARKLLD